MLTTSTGLAWVWLLLSGRVTFSAVGTIRVEVSMKNISSRKTMSVIPDMAKFLLVLFLDSSAILQLLQYNGIIPFSRNVHHLHCVTNGNRGRGDDLYGGFNLSP